MISTDHDGFEGCPLYQMLVHSHALGEKGQDANPIGNPGKQEGNEHHHWLLRIGTGERK
ncbi:MAG: hypothetical protein WAW23_04295 [Candidatus Methanoperedens sp.]